MRKYAILISFIIIAAGCKKGDSSSSTPSGPDPGKALLVFPAQNSLCTTGTVISNTASAINFSWNSTTNTDAYELDVKNLLTGNTISQVATNTSVQMILDRNTPYSWSVTSRSVNTVTATQSDTWRFYNAGLGITSYAPFQPAITTPLYGQSFSSTVTSVNLAWTDSDVDNDLVGYDVYFSTNASPALLKAAVTDMFLNNVNVTSGQTYYWYVVAKDSKGNTATSDVYHFSVK